VGHARYWIESIGPQLWQYVVAGNDEERPFSRDQRRWVYASMLAVGCIQAQRCHTDKCPTGVATQDKWLAHGLDPTVKAARAAHYIKTLRRDLLKVSEACGVEHPGLIGPEQVEIFDTLSDSRRLDEIHGYRQGWGFPSALEQSELIRLMSGFG
jgi:Conserved region in glutamate synthase